jgi:hypothetical protein
LIARRRVGVRVELDLVNRRQELGEPDLPAIGERDLAGDRGRITVAAQRENLAGRGELDLRSVGRTSTAAQHGGERDRNCGFEDSR